jgi:lipid-binding SYLF domain-containing protein
VKSLIIRTICGFAALAVTTAYAWDPEEIEERHEKAQEAKAEMLDKDSDMQRFFDTAVAYVIIPTVGKGGIGIGGARGKGLLYEGGNITGEVTLTQLTFGFQWGGQAYSEFIFFKDDVALADFKRGNWAPRLQLLLLPRARRRMPPTAAAWRSSRRRKAA